MTLDDAVAEINPCYPTLKDEGVEIRAQNDRIYDNLREIQEKIFALTDDLSPHAGLKVIANLGRRRLR